MLHHFAGSVLFKEVSFCSCALTQRVCIAIDASYLQHVFNRNAIVLRIYQHDGKVQVKVGFLQLETTPFFALISQSAEDERRELFWVGDFEQVLKRSLKLVGFALEAIVAEGNRVQNQRKMFILPRAQHDLVIEISRPDECTSCSESASRKHKISDLACIVLLMENMLQVGFNDTIASEIQVLSLVFCYVCRIALEESAIA